MDGMGVEPRKPAGTDVLKGKGMPVFAPMGPLVASPVHAPFSVTYPLTSTQGGCLIHHQWVAIIHHAYGFCGGILACPHKHSPP